MTIVSYSQEFLDNIEVATILQIIRGSMRTFNTPISLLFLALAQCMVGINIVGLKFLLAHNGPALILTGRFIIASIFLVVMHYSLRRTKDKANFLKLRELGKRDWWFLIAQALCAGVLFNFILLLGMRYTSAGVAGIVTSALPAIVVLLSIVILREKLTKKASFCLILTSMGLVVINVKTASLGSNYSSFGAIIILLALVPEAVYYVLMKLHVNKLPAFLYAAVINIINIPIVFILLAFEKHTGPLHMSIIGLLVLIAIGLASGLFYVFWLIGCRGVSGSTAGLMTAVMPIATLLLALVILHEIIGWAQFAGMLLIIGAIIVNSRRVKTRLI